MNVREMHIEVQQSVQQVAANRSRKFLDGEIDWVLNKQMHRFIQSKLRPKKDSSGRITGGFSLDQLQADAIRSLLVTNHELTAYIENSKRYKCLLPADYLHLISDYSETTQLCGTTPAVTSHTMFITKLRQSRTAKVAAPFYETMDVVMPGGTVAIPGDLPYGHAYTGYTELKDISFLSEWIRWKGGWYWERFDNLYFPNHYIQVQETDPDPVSLTIDTLDASSSGTVARIYTSHSGSGTHRVNRLCSPELIPSLLQAAYYKSSYYSPISELAGNFLWVYTDSSWTVNGVYISYIRKPQPISLSLNTDCEIAPDFHQAICDLAVEYLKGTVENEKGVILKKADLAERVIL